MAENVMLQTIERQDWLDPLADRVQGAVRAAFEAGGPTGKKVQNALHGTWLGHPLHSALTDVPIGAWTSAVVMDALEDVTGDHAFGKGADTAIAIGLAGAVASAAAGITDWHATDGRARKLGLAHGLLNVAGTLLFTASAVTRKRGSRTAGRGFSTLGFLVAMGSAYLGGKLVYDEQIGVDHTIGQQFPREYVPVIADSDLRDGELKRVSVGDARILLTRQDGRIYAIGEVCSQLGGPLAEGELQDCSVKCPWHGSRFSLEDGRVLDGPSTHPQPCLETRITDGQIEVRLPATNS